MKKLVLLLCIAFAGLFITACNETATNDVPQAVKTAFAAKYATAQDVKWEKEKEDNKVVYEAEFKYNDKKIKAEFDEAGNFLKEED